MQYFKFNPVLVVIGRAEPAQQIGDETKRADWPPSETTRFVHLCAGVLKNHVLKRAMVTSGDDIGPNCIRYIMLRPVVLAK